MSGLAFFAINLDRSPARWLEIERLFGAMPWPLHRVSAVDVRNPDAVLSVRGLTLDLPPNGVGWNPYRHRLFSLVEEACFASHMLALTAFLATDNRYAIVLEDDAVPLDGFVSAILELLGSGLDFGVVKLEGKVQSGGRWAVPVLALGNVALVRSLRPSSGGAGYLVTRAAARQIIDKAGKVLLPVDDFISNSGLHGCDVMHASPWLIVQAGADTTMGEFRTPNRNIKRRDPYHFLSQGLSRAKLRVKLWAAALGGSPLSLLRLVKAPWCAGDVREQMKRLAQEAT